MREYMPLYDSSKSKNGTENETAWSVIFKDSGDDAWYVELSNLDGPNAKKIASAYNHLGKDT